MAEQRLVQVVIPVIPLTPVVRPPIPVQPSLRPPQSNSTIPVTAHYYECCACQGLTKHLCKSDWKTAPVLLSADPDKIPSHQKHRTVEYNFVGYLKSKKELVDLYMGEMNQTICCRICDIVVFNITNPAKAPHLNALLKHVTCKKHLKKIMARKFGKDLTPQGKEKEPESCLCHVCNKFIRPKHFLRHNQTTKHKKKLEANYRAEDLTNLPPTQANKKVQKAFFDALAASGTSKDKLKFFQPFLEQFCPGGGSINRNNTPLKPKIHAIQQKGGGTLNADSDDEEEAEMDQ
ncbi:hypothetical protein RvY_12556 [Ramazzottius varieornatus]|uniref:Uncharacterized protein n=1 Tax=Ramazzottius varieornatus TaxID=947166 RepID=A0A1D1VJV9_RAMVA|nr:hypothetical protein RvY_12556 [Ramazzottius varieornatus]